MNRRWITASRVEGDASRQAHADFPPGTYEREISKEGFFGPAAFLHHKRPPTGWSGFEGPLRPRAFNLAAMNAAEGSPWKAPRVLHNRATELRFWKLEAPMPALARNADGDQILFVHAGSGDLFCDYGHIAFEAGDYLVLPRGTMWRMTPTLPVSILMIEATCSHFTLPDKGLLGGHAIFDPALFDSPKLDAAFLEHQKDDREQRVEIKKRGAISIAKNGRADRKMHPRIGSRTQPCAARGHHQDSHAPPDRREAARIDQGCKE